MCRYQTSSPFAFILVTVYVSVLYVPPFASIRLSLLKNDRLVVFRTKPDRGPEYHIIHIGHVIIFERFFFSPTEKWTSCGFYLSHLLIVFLLDLETGLDYCVRQWLYAWLLDVWVPSSMALLELHPPSRESTGAMPLPWLYPPHPYQTRSEMRSL